MIRLCSSVSARGTTHNVMGLAGVRSRRGCGIDVEQQVGIRVVDLPVIHALGLPPAPLALPALVRAASEHRVHDRLEILAVVPVPGGEDVLVGRDDDGRVFDHRPQGVRPGDGQGPHALDAAVLHQIEVGFLPVHQSER